MVTALLPRLVQEAISSACQSDRQLSWKIQESGKGTLIQLVWKPTPVDAPEKRKAVLVGSNWNTSSHSLSSVVKDPDKPSTSRLKKRKRRNCPSRQHRSAQRLAKFLDKKKPSASNSCDLSPFGTPAACGENSPLAPATSSTASGSLLSSSDGPGKDGNSQVLATPGTSLALELSCYQQVDFEVREDSPGLRYTTPDGSKKWTPVVVNVCGHISEFNVFDLEGIPKNVSFCMLNDTPCLVTSFGPDSKVYTPIAKRMRSRVNV